MEILAKSFSRPYKSLLYHQSKLFKKLSLIESKSYVRDIIDIIANRRIRIHISSGCLFIGKKGPKILIRRAIHF
jgi:hypothetical protein